MRRRSALVGSLVLAVAMVASANGASGSPGFTTSQDAMLVDTGNLDDVEITPLLTVGDTLPSGFRFEAVPDGISVRTRGQGRVDVYVNHETSKVPFPYNPNQWTTDPGESQNDFDNAQVSRLILNKVTGGVINGSFAIRSSAGFQRFCSNYLATAKEGFDRPILFTNEESPDYVFRQGDSWPPPIGDPDQREAGLVVALETQSGKIHTIPGMGRHNHENSVAIPGADFEDLVVMSGDDTFTSGPLTGVTFPADVSAPAQSQLYSYIAPDTESLLEDEGDLWAFVSDTPGVKNYYDVLPGSGTIVTGHFVQVPKYIATGVDPNDGTEITSGDVLPADGGPFPAPPTNGSWQTDLRSPSPVGIDGPQWVLEYWSDIHDVFQFVRVEDIAYDKRPGMGNIVYIVDSGRGRRADQSLDTPNFRSTNGRVWKMVLDPEDPTQVDSLTVLVEGDDNPVKTLTEIRQPDNIETTATGMLVTEDPGSSQQFAVGDPDGRTAGLWYVPYSGAGAQLVATVDQSADEGPTDVDPPDNPPFVGGSFPISPGNWGGWESSGIVDASAAFGDGAFLIDVQAHTLWVDSAPGFDTFIDANTDPDFTFKREGGQLLLIRIPGI